MMTETYEYTGAWTGSLKAEGRAEGEAIMLLRVLERDSITVTEEAREHILNSRDLEQIEFRLTRSKNVTHIDELFED